MSYTKEQSLAEITKLVDSFKANEARLKSEAEAQIENNFIRPLFKYLNWNTHNQGLAVADYEFLVQKTHRHGKRPDYILQLDGQHLMVMDAKQVKYDMKDARWMNQVYAYAYSTQNLTLARKIDFAVLTDFQEFVVLDCTLYANDPKAVLNFRVLDWKCDDYVAKFDTLWDLFERENVRAAAKTRGTENPHGLWALALSPKKIKANRIPPDKAFLHEMDNDQNGWRVRLAKDMKKRNPQADGTLITAAVQLLIDRLIFVKALSDREIEDDYLAQMAEAVERDGLGESDTGWFTACRTIFAKLNQFYNGSIFEPRPELEAVTVSNKIVREVLRALLPENSPYNFAVLPVEILGTIYERFLGRVVRTTDQRVKIEDKPEVRKAGGVYYTPQYIVDYIVQNTVGKLLESCRTPDDVARLKILDPACGSGSFLLGAYAALIDWHVKYYSDKEWLAKKDRNAAYYDSDGRVRLTAQVKRQILLNNLFGVDIDPQAVEVTSFSLSLKALEDTHREELYDERTLFKQTVLPDLRDNIKCGNSLIGPDYFTGQMFTDPVELKRVNPFDWQREFPQVFANGGFDAVIGNPPYIRIQTLQETGPEQVAHLKAHYRAAGSGNYDIYVVFVEKGLSLLNERGRLGFILPHKFFNAKYGEALRGLIAEGKHLAHVVHFGDQQVFDGATTYTALMFLDKHGNDTFDLVRVSDLETWQAGEPQTHGEMKAEVATAKEWKFARSSSSDLLSNSANIITLEGFGHIFQGLATSADSVYALELVKWGLKVSVVKSRELDEEFKIETSILHSLLKGAEIRRYEEPVFQNVVLFPYKVENEKATVLSERELKSEYPLAFAYLARNRNRLLGRSKVEPKTYWHYPYPKNLTLYSHPKILVQVLSTQGNFTLDLTGKYYFLGGGTAGGNAIRLPNNDADTYKYLLGVLNSKLLTHHVRKVGSTFRGGYFAFGKGSIASFPIRSITFTDPVDKARHDKMVGLVESMLALHKHKAAAKTQADQNIYQRQIEVTDREIDALVYELYGLTPEEIAIVEGQTPITQKISEMELPVSSWKDMKKEIEEGRLK